MAFGKFRLATVVGLVALTGGATLVSGQSSIDAVAMQAEDEIRAIDPTTGGDSLVFDPSLPQPYAPAEETLPELPSAPSALTDVALQNAQDDIMDAPRGPAVRMIEAQAGELPELPSAPADITARTMEQTPIAPAPAPVVAQAPEDPFVINSILPVEGTIRYGEWFWDESRAPAKGKLVITVDLDARVISVFRDGHEIGTAVALLGTKSHPTPLGTFPILTKEKDNVSEKYDNAPMPWTLRLTWSGIAIHGSPVMNGYASHGCVGVPDEFAEKLFAIAKRGDKVVITRGQMVGVGDKLLNS
ncbi:L,D-transpeptidase family protein [uncultured Erythrobacter sp.]|uniref:L,D-transpeptidase family protein n=1 Tax=uncultured Erythrobacter sp. TaxID=263913 RepID=UPI00261A2C02|nr:L,D-transpeptidase family protein [uncultured Erythrobacter sp.]